MKDDIYNCDEFEAVSKCNFRDIKNGVNCFIYLKSVLEHTKELCDAKGLKYKVEHNGDFYKIVSLEKKGAKRY